MFEYRKGRTAQEVSALFGEGIELVDKSYVEDPDTGSILAPAGGYGPEQQGGVYALRWHGQPIGLEFRITRRDDEHGPHPLFTLSQLGTSDGALVKAGIAHVELTPEDATRALQVAAEACVVYESHRADYGPGTRVGDPLDASRELSPVDFGYDEITRAPWGVR
ncbi:MAG: hypothetical protein HGA44_21040 [Cellulomonadaceae bacterium]|nr:hypothetical protein [Cellulomonadaceae bacterium]